MAAGDINDPLTNVPNVVTVDQPSATAAPGAGYGRWEIVDGIPGIRIGAGAWVPILALPDGTPGDVVGYDGGTGALTSFSPSWGNGPYNFVSNGRVVVPGGGQATITLPSSGSIPGGGESLAITLQGRSDQAASYQSEIHLTLNGDSGNNYDSVGVQGGNAASAYEVFAGAYIIVGYLPAASSLPNAAGCVRVELPSYARTTFFKTLLAQGVNPHNTSTPHQWAGALGGQWRSTAAITSVTLTLAAGNFAEGTVATLYRIAGA